MIDLKLILKTGFATLVILFVLGYSLFEFRRIIQGPIIEISEPQDGASYNKNPIKIAGVAKNISHLKLNDWPIAINEKGEFEEKLLLSPGYNIMKLESQDRFGRKNIKYLELLYKL